MYVGNVVCGCCKLRYTVGRDGLEVELKIVKDPIHKCREDVHCLTIFRRLFFKGSFLLVFVLTGFMLHRSR